MCRSIGTSSLHFNRESVSVDNLCTIQGSLPLRYRMFYPHWNKKISDFNVPPLTCLFGEFICTSKFEILNRSSFLFPTVLDCMWSVRFFQRIFLLRKVVFREEFPINPREETQQHRVSPIVVVSE